MINVYDQLTLIQELYPLFKTLTKIADKLKAKGIETKISINLTEGIIKIWFEKTQK